MMIATVPANAESSAHFEARFVAGSLRADLGVDPQVAAGVTACAETQLGAGGACFGLGQFPDGSGLFVQASSDVPLTRVSIFAGFDLDGDGCIGCTGADRAVQGEGSLGITKPNGGDVLKVFIRAANVGGQYSGQVDTEVEVAFTGTVTVDVFPPAPACSDGIDNDGDGLTDYPADPGCDSPFDNSEDNPTGPPQCSDGIDNDGDGLTDYPADPGCDDQFDDDETDPTGPRQCSDGIDNDGDGLTDYPEDPGCDSPDDNSEDTDVRPQCSDGIDNDGDGFVDADDPGCTGPDDDNEGDDPTGNPCPEGSRDPEKCGEEFDEPGPTYQYR